MSAHPNGIYRRDGENIGEGTSIPGVEAMMLEILGTQSQGSNINHPEGQLNSVLKHLGNMSTLIGESFQLRTDALKCFQDNLHEMKKFHDATELKLNAFRNLVTTVGPAVGLKSKN